MQKVITLDFSKEENPQTAYDLFCKVKDAGIFSMGKEYGSDVEFIGKPVMLGSTTFAIESDNDSVLRQMSDNVVFNHEKGYIKFTGNMFFGDVYFMGATPFDLQFNPIIPKPVIEDASTMIGHRILIDRKRDYAKPTPVDVDDDIVPVFAPRFTEPEACPSHRTSFVSEPDDSDDDRRSYGGGESDGGGSSDSWGSDSDSSDSSSDSGSDD